MKLLISEIPDEGILLESEETLESDAVKFASPVSVKLYVRKVATELIIQGNVTARVELSCSRCLGDYTTGIDVSVNVLYHPVEELRAEGKHEVREDELETGFYSGDEFDLLELIKEQVLLNVPMKPLCKETCKGICPKCGADLNIKKCDCDLDVVDSRLEILKGLLRRE